MMRSGLVAAALAAVACGACSVLFSPSADQCTTDGDCTARGAAFASTHCSADSLCVSTVGLDAALDADDPLACGKLPAASPDPTKQLDMTMRFTDFSTGLPPENTLVRLCSAIDTNCINARTTLEGDGPGDAGPEGGKGWFKPRADGGMVSTKIEFGFEGFFEVRAPQYPPSFRSTSPPLRNPTNDFEQLLFRPVELKFLSDELLGPGSYESVGHGLVFLFARDCNLVPIPGVTFTTSATDPLLQLFYLVNSAPSITDTKSDALGRGGYVNVPPGLHTFSAYFGEGDNAKRLGSARMLIRAGAVTTLAVPPSP